MGQDERSATEDLEPQPRLPHLEDPRFEVQLVGERCVDVSDVFVFRDVLEELCYRAVYEFESASATLLTGGWFVGPFGPFIEIDGFRDATGIDGVLRYLHGLRADRAQLQGKRGERVVGCCLVLPGSGGRMGADELILCNTFFSRPYHVLLVIDGAADAFGFYVRDAAARFHNTATYVLSEASAGSATLDPEAGSVVGSPGSNEVEDGRRGGPALAGDAEQARPETAAAGSSEGEEDHDGDR